MNLLLAVFIGSVIGWIGARLTEDHTGMVDNVAVGILGALFGGLLGLLVAGEMGGGNYLQFSWTIAVWSIASSAAVVGILHANNYQE